MKIVVLDGFAADQGQPVWEGLFAHGEVTLYPRTGPDDLLARAANAEVLLTNKVLLDAEVIANLPVLRYVGIVATGTNAVDLSACRERSIAVTNVPGYSTHSVAQLVFALMLHLTHDVAGHDARSKSGGWAASPDFMFCLRPLVELAGKTMTVVGTGAIGSAVSDIGRAFGMRVLSAAVPGSFAARSGASSSGRVALDEALPVSDFVSLHCPLTPLTHHLVGSEFLRRVKRGAILINTGRGALVDERALLRALETETLGGAALDVLEREPPASNHPLLDPSAPWAARLVVTPHIGWATVEARARLIGAVIDNLAAFLRGETTNRVEQLGQPQKLSVRPV